MTPERMKLLASHIFGQNGWQTRLADRLNISRSTLCCYIKRKINMPVDMNDSLKTLWEDHKKKGDKLFK